MEKKEKLSQLIYFEIYKFLEPISWFTDIRLVDKLSQSNPLLLHLLENYIQTIDDKFDKIKEKIPFSNTSKYWKNQLLILPKEVLLHSKDVDRSLNVMKELLRLNNNLVLPSNLSQQEISNMNTYLRKDVSKYNFMSGIELEPLEASSTDYVQQSIWNTIIRNSEFWSSVGYETDQSVDHLTFKFTQPLSLIGSVSIKNYQALYQQNDPIFGAKRLRVSIGFTKENFHFTTEFALENHKEEQIFNFYPYLVLGSYIKFEFLGKYTTQKIDMLYYTAIEEVFAYGFPLEIISSLRSIINDYLIEQNIMTSEFYAYLNGKDKYLNSVYFKEKFKEFLDLFNVVKDNKNTFENEEEKKADKKKDALKLHKMLINNMKNRMNDFSETDMNNMYEQVNKMESSLNQDQNIVIDNNFIQSQLFTTMLQEVQKSVGENPEIFNVLAEPGNFKADNFDMNDKNKLMRFKEFILENPLFFLYNKEEIFKIIGIDLYKTIMKIPEKSITHRLKKDIDLLIKFDNLNIQEKIKSAELINNFGYYHITDKEYTVNYIIKLLREKELNQNEINYVANYLLSTLGICWEDAFFESSKNNSFLRVVDLDGFMRLISKGQVKFNTKFESILNCESNAYIKLRFLSNLYRISNEIFIKNEVLTNVKTVRDDCIVF
jgi:hypothetical protein